MRLRWLWTVGVIFVLVGALRGGDDVRSKLIGSWCNATDGNSSGSVWSLEDRGESIRIIQLLGGQKIADVECNTMGRECEVKDSGRHVKVSMWFNGPKLVQMETRGAEITKRSFAILKEGDAMEIEVIPIAPAGKTEVVHLQRVHEPGAHK